MVLDNATEICVGNGSTVVSTRCLPNDLALNLTLDTSSAYMYLDGLKNGSYATFRQTLVEMSSTNSDFEARD